MSFELPEIISEFWKHDFWSSKDGFWISKNDFWTSKDKIWVFNDKLCISKEEWFQNFQIVYPSKNEH